MTTINLPTEIGRLIEQRKPYRDRVEIFEHFNILVGGLREWPDATPENKVGIAKNINRARRELAELGVHVGA